MLMLCKASAELRTALIAVHFEPTIDKSTGLIHSLTRIRYAVWRPHRHPFESGCRRATRSYSASSQTNLIRISQITNLSFNEEQSEEFARRVAQTLGVQMNAQKAQVSSWFVVASDGHSAIGVIRQWRLISESEGAVECKIKVRWSGVLLL